MNTWVALAVLFAALEARAMIWKKSPAWYEVRYRVSYSWPGTDFEVRYTEWDKLTRVAAASDATRPETCAMVVAFMREREAARARFAAIEATGPLKFGRSA